MVNLWRFPVNLKENGKNNCGNIKYRINNSLSYVICELMKTTFLLIYIIVLNLKMIIKLDIDNSLLE